MTGTGMQSAKPCNFTQHFRGEDDMKVLQIANDYLGTALYASLFHALGDAGVSNVVFVPVRRGGKYRKENDSLREKDESSLIISPCFSSLDRLVYYSKQNKIFAGIRQTVDLDSIRCVHAHTLFSAGYTAMRIKRENGIPYITAVRNVDLNVFFKRMKYLRGVGVDVMREAEWVVFLSPAYKKTILQEYVPVEYRDEIDGKSLVIPNGISEIFLTNTPRGKKTEAGKLKLIYAGEINKNKNLEQTIESCKILLRQGYDCSYTVVGDVTDRSCANLLKEDFIVHFPKCSQNELINHYRNNDIFVMPSHTETFGLVYAEALSQGLPVIYTRGQGFDGHFPDGEVGFSVSDTDAAGMAKKIIEAYTSYDKLSSNALEAAGRFDWMKIGARYKELYGSIKCDKSI